MENDIVWLLDYLPVSEETLAKMLHTCVRNVRRWKTGNTKPCSDNFKRICQLKKIAELGMLIYMRDGWHAFLSEPQPAFKGKTAFQLIIAGEADKVLDALMIDYNGGLGS